MRSASMYFYLLGYKGVLLPRFVRRLFARSTLHDAWLLGYMGVYEECGRRVGALERSWHSCRNAGGRRLLRTDTPPG